MGKLSPFVFLARVFVCFNPDSAQFWFYLCLISTKSIQKIMKKYWAEMIGTTVLVLMGCGAGSTLGVHRGAFPGCSYRNLCLERNCC